MVAMQDEGNALAPETGFFNSPLDGESKKPSVFCAKADSVGGASYFVVYTS